MGAPVSFDWEAKCLRQLVLEIVAKPMQTAEVCVAVVEAGHKPKMIPGHFRTHVFRRLKEAGFREKGGKWGN